MHSLHANELEELISEHLRMASSAMAVMSTLGFGAVMFQPVDMPDNTCLWHLVNELTSVKAQAVSTL